MKIYKERKKNIKARELENLNNTIQVLLPMQLKMPFAYKVACIAREVRENYSMINVMRQEILERYAKRDENGQVIIDQQNGMVTVEPEKVMETNKELDKLFSRDIELKCDKIKIDDIKDLDLTVGQLEALIPLVEE